MQDNGSYVGVKGPGVQDNGSHADVKGPGVRDDESQKEVKKELLGGAVQIDCVRLVALMMQFFQGNMQGV